MSISTVSFDMNGTITQGRFVDLVWGEGVPSLYARSRGLPLDKAKEIVFQEYAEVGEQEADWYDIRYWFRRFDLGDDWRGLLMSFRDEVAPFPDAADVLAEMGKKYRLIVTSNASRDFTDIELAAAGLEGYFSHLFSCTSDFGEVKKTPEVYARVCEALSISPQEMAHVGDHPLFDYVAPRRLGIRAFHLDRSAISDGDFVVRNLREFMARVRYGDCQSDPGGVLA
ncbi:MAG: HAD family hydrolase [Dehalococcoidia bacterium]|nr:HAD family hydrolase [Dehalococcoidia bacterium]